MSKFNLLCARYVFADLFCGLLSCGMFAQAATPSSGLNPEQRHRADALISIFENGTPKIQYGYAENIRDGRGITAGRAGFTTATGDALEVVQRYASLKPQSPLAKYLPVLTKLAQQKSGLTSGLAGFASAWKKAAQDPTFRTVQDQVTNELYFDPAMRKADSMGLKTALGRTILFDTIVQHGEGDDPDSLDALVSATNQQMHGTPAEGMAEAAWLKTFLTVRRNNLLHPHNPETQEVWAKSVGRVDVFLDLLKAGNFDLKKGGDVPE